MFSERKVVRELRKLNSCFSGHVTNRIVFLVIGGLVAQALLSPVANAGDYFVDFTQGSGPDPSSNLCKWDNTYTRQINVGPSRFSYGRLCGTPNNTFYRALDPDKKGNGSTPYLHIDFSQKVSWVSIEGTAAFHPGSSAIVLYSDNFKSLTYKVNGNFGSSRDALGQLERTPSPFYFTTGDSRGITSIDLISSYEKPADHCIGCGCYSLNIRKVNFKTIDPITTTTTTTTTSTTRPAASNLKAMTPSINPNTGDMSIPWQVNSTVPFRPGGISVVTWLSSGQTQSPQVLLGQWGLDPCVNKANCSVEIKVPLAQRTAIPKGHSWLISSIDPTNNYKETNEGDNVATKMLDDFFVEKIPDIMGRVGPYWGVAKDHLNAWMNFSTARTKSSTSGDFDGNLPVVQTVSTSWLLDPKSASNSRIRDKFNKLIQPSSFLDAVATAAIEATVRNNFKRFPTYSVLPLSWRYGGTGGLNAKDYDKQKIQTIEGQAGGNSGTIPPLDPVTAAFGGFDFRFVPVGHAEKIGSTYKISLWIVEVYVVDSFDFNGFQPLGCWGEPNKVGYLPSSGLTCVFNSTFQWYRRMKARGGDYTLITPPIEVALKDSSGNPLIRSWVINR